MQFYWCFSLKKAISKTQGEKIVANSRVDIIIDDKMLQYFHVSILSESIVYTLSQNIWVL